MSAESQALERDYIRLTERFKALSAFDQFLQGIHRAFLPVGVGNVVDLEPLYEELKSLSPGEGAGTSEPPECSRRELEAKFDAAASQLSAADTQLSPSLTRRYFEKVRPSDRRIPFYILRFYASQSQTDENLLDKVDYLATVLAAGSPDPAASPQRSRGEIRKLFDPVLLGSVWPSVDGDTAAEIARAFDEVAAEISAASELGSLAGEGWIEKEERILRGVSRRIQEMEQRASSRGLEDSAALRLFQESRRELDRQLAAGSVRWRQLLEARQAASEALKMLGASEEGASEETGAEAEAALGALEDPFWGPCLRRVLATLGDGGAVQSLEGLRSLAQWKLETWETDAARQLIARRPLSRSDLAVISAAALRVKAESETEATRKHAGSCLPADLLQEARATLAHASELDRAFAELAGAIQTPTESGEQIRCWTRTRLRLLHATSALWLAFDGP